MKHLLILSFFFLGLNTNAQHFSSYNKLDLETEEDYLEHQDKALTCADYLLDHSPEEKSLNIEHAGLFLLNWMVGSPYSFELWEWGGTLAKKQSELIITYFACILKAGLEHDLFEGIDAQLKAAEIMYDYLKNPKFDVKRKGPVKKFIKAGDEGNLKEFISE